MAAARFMVAGRVQGVGFRAATRARALELGLTGRARNLVDGRVEVRAHGAPAALDRFEQWLRAGPPAASVEVLERLPLHGPADPDFTIA